MSKETPKFKDESRESRERLGVDATEYSRVSRMHPDRNEDALLGDVERITREERKMPRFGDDESILVADAAMDKMFEAHADAVRAAGEKEKRAAAKLKELNVTGIFDGVGGREGKGTGGGYVASRIASGETAERIAERLTSNDGVDATMDAFKDALISSHARILEYKKAHGEVLDTNGKQSLRNMGTTVDLLRIIPDAEGGEMVWGHSGDGRIYHLDAETGEVKQMTKDDTGLDQMVEQKFLTKKQADIVRDNYRKGDEAVRKLLPDLPDHVFKFAMKAPQSLAASLGAERMTPAVGSFRVKKGDRVLVSTDGVHDNLSDEQIAELMRAGAGAKEIADAAYANAGGDSGNRKEGAKGPDDITLNVLEFGESRAEAPKAEAPAESMHDLKAGVVMARKALENAKTDQARYDALMELQEKLRDVMDAAAGDATDDLELLKSTRDELRDAVARMRELRESMTAEQTAADAAGVEAARSEIDTLEEADLIGENAPVPPPRRSARGAIPAPPPPPPRPARRPAPPPPPLRRAPESTPPASVVKPKKRGFFSRLFGRKDDAA